MIFQELKQCLLILAISQYYPYRFFFPDCLSPVFYGFSLLRALYNNSTLFVQIAFTCLVFPCLLLAYMGQSAYLMKYPVSAERIFYDSVPGEFCQSISVVPDHDLEIT